jgi:flagella synthesis protein FlgN
MASPITTVRDELSLFTTLMELMKREQQFLVSADTDALNTLTPQKAQLVVQMAALSKQRHAQLAEAGHAPEDASMQAWLDNAGDSAASELWLDLLAVTRQAKEINRVNGMLIAKQLTNNQTIINAMRTPSGAADNAVYGPTGQTSSTATSRRVVIG